MFNSKLKIWSPQDELLKRIYFFNHRVWMIFYKYFDEISVRFIPFHVKASSIVSILFAMKNRLHEKSSLTHSPLLSNLYDFEFWSFSHHFLLLRVPSPSSSYCREIGNWAEFFFFFSKKRKLRLISDEQEREREKPYSSFHINIFSFSRTPASFFYVFGHLFSDALLQQWLLIV